MGVPSAEVTVWCAMWVRPEAEEPLIAGPSGALPSSASWPDEALEADRGRVSAPLRRHLHEPVPPAEVGGGSATGRTTAGDGASGTRRRIRPDRRVIGARRL